MLLGKDVMILDADGIERIREALVTGYTRQELAAKDLHGLTIDMRNFLYEE